MHGAPSTNCRCEEAETKATVTLMASLVIKRPLMYVLNRLFYLLHPLCLLLSLSLLGSTSFFINAVFRECSFAQSPQHTSDICLTLMYVCRFLWHQSLASKEHHNARFVAILRVCSSPVLEVGGNKNTKQDLALILYL